MAVNQPSLRFVYVAINRSKKARLVFYAQLDLTGRCTSGVTPGVNHELFSG